jgi:hypothetical protein
MTRPIEAVLRAKRGGVQLNIRKVFLMFGILSVHIMYIICRTLTLVILIFLNEFIFILGIRVYCFVLLGMELETSAFHLR